MSKGKVEVFAIERKEDGIVDIRGTYDLKEHDGMGVKAESVANAADMIRSKNIVLNSLMKKTKMELIEAWLPIKAWLKYQVKHDAADERVVGDLIRSMEVAIFEGHKIMMPK